MSKAVRLLVCVAVAGLIAAPLMAADPVKEIRERSVITVGLIGTDDSAPLLADIAHSTPMLAIHAINAMGKTQRISRFFRFSRKVVVIGAPPRNNGPSCWGCWVMSKMMSAPRGVCSGS